MPRVVNGVWTAGVARRRRRRRLTLFVVLALAAAVAWTFVEGHAQQRLPDRPYLLLVPLYAELQERTPLDLSSFVDAGEPDGAAAAPGTEPAGGATGSRDDDRGTYDALSGTPTPMPAAAEASDPPRSPDEQRRLVSRTHDRVDVPADTADDEDDLPSSEIVTMQRRLQQLGYLVGDADGKLGQQTRGAVMAFQQVHGLDVDGVAGPTTRAALAWPSAEPVLAGGPPTRIEVDLDAQLLHVVDDDVRIATLKASSGNGAAYRTRSGGTARGRTPVGEFVVQRRIEGRRVSHLGTLYDPLYFYRGWAIHGSTSVPAGPASHGCIRVTMADGRWLFDQVGNGTPVHIYGGEHVFEPAA